MEECTEMGQAQLAKGRRAKEGVIDLQHRTSLSLICIYCTFIEIKAKNALILKTIFYQSDAWWLFPKLL